MNLELDAHPELKKGLHGFENNKGRFLVRIEARFESSHYLYKYLENGQDEPMHGHSWLVQLFLSHQNEKVKADGISFDFLLIRKALDKLIERIEHLCINNLEEFHGINPTAENIARWFYQGLKMLAKKEKGKIIEVRVHEGPSNVAIFNPS